MLDVAIGMTFVFLLISLICTAINELLEAFVKNRAKDLEKGIRELIGKAQETSGTEDTPADYEYVKRLYEHPLVYGLFQGKYTPNSKELPSYIPARTFALAIMDVVLSAKTDVKSGASNTAPATSTAPTTDSSTATVTINNNVGETASGEADTGAASSPSLLAAFRAAVANNLPEGLNLKRALLTLTDAAGNDIAAVRTNIETWYNGSMDRVSGWYKRRAQLIVLVVGFLVAVGINADAIAVFKSLSNDSALRESVVGAAAGYARTAPATPRDTARTAGQAIVALDSALTQLEALNLPIGWQWKAAAKGKVSNAELAVPSTFWAWVGKVLGWLITGIAVSLGAPFWFDVLNKFMVVRSTVKPHEKSLEESSEG